jgi:hypothetical protein
MICCCAQDQILFVCIAGWCGWHLPWVQECKEAAVVKWLLCRCKGLPWGAAADHWQVWVNAFWRTHARPALQQGALGQVASTPQRLMPPQAEPAGATAAAAVQWAWRMPPAAGRADAVLAAVAGDDSCEARWRRGAGMLLLPMVVVVAWILAAAGAWRNRGGGAALEIELMIALLLGGDLALLGGDGRGLLPGGRRTGGGRRGGGRLVGSPRGPGGGMRLRRVGGGARRFAGGWLLAVMAVGGEGRSAWGTLAARGGRLAAWEDDHSTAHSLSSTCSWPSSVRRTVKGPVLFAGRL